MANRTRRLPLVRSAPRSNVWVGLGLANTGVVAATPTLLSSLNAAALALRPFTIVRSRMIISITSDQVAASEFVQGAFGGLVVKETASSAGVGSIPTPLTETNADWHIYQGFVNDFTFVSAVGVLESTGSQSAWVIDSKSMRKVGIDDDCVHVVENRANGFNIAIEGRMLVKLH